MHYITEDLTRDSSQSEAYSRSLASGAGAEPNPEVFPSATEPESKVGPERMKKRTARPAASLLDFWSLWFEPVGYRKQSNADVHYASYQKAATHYASHPNAGIHYASYPNAGIHYASHPNAGIHYASYQKAAIHYASHSNAGIHYASYQKPQATSR
ncbi:hypothetical protein P7K49_030749 [Saguinus oedipus]|uniref:Uncharacterized protein n=1 Tax=Saguinus oedipus TaxID=9490 RepID=A0ABQ9U3Z3_SAGOE|nr:hypothetical protein P7K49_030749 [Saguinus oedipus]